jgi:hypothetical protein
MRIRFVVNPEGPLKELMEIICCSSYVVAHNLEYGVARRNCGHRLFGGVMPLLNSPTRPE